MWSDLQNKSILVTGAGKGIGNALCIELANFGAIVYAVARSKEQLQELATHSPNIKPILVDLQDWQGVRAVLNAKVTELDGLVNNAGIAIIKPFDQLSEKDFDDTFNVNIKAVFNVTQTLLPKLKDGASIVNVSSLAATRAFDGHSAYCASKAAVNSLTRSLALENSSRKIRSNSVDPTVVFTKMGRDNWSDPAKVEPLLSRIPLRRFCEVEEVVNAICYLLSSKSSYVNGQHINLEGGYSVT